MGLVILKKCEEVVSPKIKLSWKSRISKDVIEIAQRCRNRSIGKVFVSGIVYYTKVRYETMQNLKKSLYEECMKYGFCFIDNGTISEKDLLKDGIHLIHGLTVSFTFRKLQSFY